MSADDWAELKDDIAFAIDMSMEMDWTADVGAASIVEMLKTQGYRIEMPKGSTDD
jgi:hypothetical protein